MLGLFSSSPPPYPPAVAEPRAKPSYFAATRHPLPCLIFLLPLLLIYEGSVIYLGDTNPDALRNGADCWLHGSLTAFGLHELYWAPFLLVVTLILWCFARRSDQPEDLTGTCTGMAIESVFVAIGLWAVSRGLRPLLDRLGVVLQMSGSVDATTANLVSYLGAGIYEEAIFRLALFTVLCALLRQGGLPDLIVLLLATAAAALAFAAAHHIGPGAEPFEAYTFLFRTVAGLYFTLVYRFRGFGIAVGAHACYDVFVGVAIG